MAHITLDELAAGLADAATRVTVGGRYAHYKHPEVPYLVTGLSVLEATDEIAVRYAMVGRPEVEFVRALESWLKTVEWDGQIVPRFTKLR